MRVLIACEFSGVVRRAFRARGFDAWSCDLLPADDGSPFHLIGDVREHLDAGWWMMIGHPPCTYATNSSVQWLMRTPANPRPGVLYGAERWAALDESCAFFRDLLDAPVHHIAIENPIPHRYAVERIGRKYDQCVQPWMFGHMETKATCLWLQDLPQLRPTNDVRAEMMELPAKERARVHHASPGPDRWKQRSVTYTGIAEAMAEQWGAHVRATHEAEMQRIADEGYDLLTQGEAA